MRLVKMEMEGFRSFVEKTEFKFPDRAGLFLIKGKNKVEPALGGNAAGKSALIEAVCWNFYGKTSRRLSAGAIESWKTASACLVRSELEIGGELRIIERTRRPISLKLDGEPVEQEVIDDLLGLSYERFLHVVLMGQFGTLFPDLKPADRLSLLSEVLELDLWTAAAERAGAQAKEAALTLSESEAKLGALRERRRTLQEGLQRAEENRDRWDAERLDRVQDAKEKALLAARMRAKQGELLTHAETELEKATEEHERTERALGEQEKARRLVSEKVSKIDGELTGFRRDAQRTGKMVEDAATMKACPTCGRDFSDASILLTREEAKRQHDEANELLEAALKEYNAHKGELVSINNRMQTLAQEHSAAKQALKTAERNRNELSNAIKQMDAELEVSRSTVKTEEDMENPHEREMSSLKIAIEAAIAEEENKELEWYDLQTQVDLLSFWPKGFKELRLWLVDEALAELTIHANSSLVELGLLDWQMSFRVERETQKGNVSRGFEVLVKSPDSPEEVPWESWSGGETQRLRIACSIGLANLIRARMPNAPELEIWDEPTSFLAEEGVQDLIDFFSERAEERQVFLIDHRSLDSGAFDRIFTVTKDKQGSHIQ